MLFPHSKSLSDAKDLVLLVVGLAGGHLTTETKLQKIAFLLNREVFDGRVRFEPTMFGMYSKDVAKAVVVLEKEGLLTQRDEDGTTHYYLTRKGEEAFKRVASSLGDDKLTRAEKVVSEFKDAPLDYVLAYMFVKYPEYFNDPEKEWFFERLARKYGMLLDA